MAGEDAKSYGRGLDDLIDDVWRGRGGVLSPMKDKIVILVMCGSVAEGDRIARALVESRLAACGNLLETPVRSTYRWKGQVESAVEYLLLIKTSRRLFARVQAKVKELHSYEVPEIIALPILEGLPAYLAWIGESVSRASHVAKRNKMPKARRKK
jgi:periplasmic divalent cation tolerance protein